MLTFFTALNIYIQVLASSSSDKNWKKQKRKAVHRGDEDRHQRSTSQPPSLTAGHFPHLEGQLGSGFWTSKEQAVLAIVSHGCQMCNSQLAVRAVRNDHRCPILRTAEAVLIVWLESRCVCTVVQIILCHSGTLTYWISNKSWLWLSFHLCYTIHKESSSKQKWFLLNFLRYLM